MTKEAIHSKVQDIFRDIFDDETLNITEQTHSEDIEEWDSLSHINLVAAIEKEFCVKFALGELQELKNVGDMLNLIIKKRV
ncbi:MULTISPECIES: acyl carrier protein [Helicobacter]|uniref:Acyl carrier protein n=1 Tax=Helicobacter bilis ATCC 43879 TaxID=613026 RepID=C3XH41_9HELI|nr:MULTISPECIES: acyl carrier protein [Helicobacter]EEO24330.1 acyl carrier protein [Helicobacter bilis ATCC 43879]